MSKPGNTTANRFFSNTGERIVFWVAIAGLLLVTALSMFRYYQMKDTVNEYHSVQGHHQLIMDTNKELKMEVKQLQSKVDSLQSALQHSIN